METTVTRGTDVARRREGWRCGTSMGGLGFVTNKLPVKVPRAQRDEGTAHRAVTATRKTRHKPGRS